MTYQEAIKTLRRHYGVDPEIEHAIRAIKTRAVVTKCHADGWSLRDLADQLVELLEEKP